MREVQPYPTELGKLEISSSSVKLAPLVVLEMEAEAEPDEIEAARPCSRLSFITLRLRHSITRACCLVRQLRGHFVRQACHANMAKISYLSFRHSRRGTRRQGEEFSALRYCDFQIPHQHAGSPALAFN